MTVKRIVFVFFCICYHALPIYSQPGTTSQQVSRELEFITYLMNREDFRESLYLLEKLEVDNGHQSDSVLFLKGWIHYSTKSLSISAAYLEQVSEQSALFLQSSLFSAYNYAHMGQLSAAENVLSRLSGLAHTPSESLVRLQAAGLSLLQRDFDEFTGHAAGFTGQMHVTSPQEARMLQHALELESWRNKSPFTAGMISAFVPGMGKVYAGKTAEGIAGLLYVSAMGLTAWDFYRGRGPKDPLFIVSATLAGIFYAGNIKGSVAAARRANTEFNHEMDQRILFDMHIPLRSFFR